MADLATNRKAFHDYQVLEKLECGIVLCGTEVKSCRAGNISFVDSYGRVVSGEVYLYNIHISEYEQGNRENHDPKRTRKLLLHKSEIRKLIVATQKKGLTLIPISVYLRKGKIKVGLGICRGKSKADKREVMKRKQDEKEFKKIMKQR
jgi:SsrA-binding protein